MRTITTNLYKFSELSEDAQAKAIEKYRQQNWERGYNWADEAYDSIRKFCKEFNLVFDSASFSTNADANVSQRNISDEVKALKGKRLVAYLWNNFDDILIAPKAYGEYENKGTKEKPNWRHKRYSRCQKEEKSCPFTGVCFDESLLYPIRQYLKKADLTTDYEDLLNDCINSWVSDARADCESQESDEYLKEEIEANEYEFTEDGIMA